MFLSTIVLFFVFKDKDREGEPSNTSYGNFKQILGDQAMAQKMREVEIGVDNDKRDVVGIQRGVMMSEAIYTHKAVLSDVSGGKALGLAKAGYDNGAYNLSASFSGLTEPENGDFYEGWVVRQEPFSFISTGRVEKLGGVYNNLYKSETNLMSYDFYVLTIETNDGDPTPGVHILEGYLISK